MISFLTVNKIVLPPVVAKVEPLGTIAKTPVEVLPEDE